MKELNKLIEMPDIPLRKKSLLDAVDGRVDQLIDEGFVDEVTITF